MSEKVSDFSHLLEDVMAWHLRVFGHPASSSRTSQKLLEEAAEVFAAARAGDEAGIGKELIDVLLVTCSLLSVHGSGNEMADIRKKMAEVEARNQRARDQERLG